MNIVTENNNGQSGGLNSLPGFTPDLHRMACRLVLDLQEKQALPSLGNKISSAKTYPEVVEELSNAKVRLRLKRITSEVPKFD